MNLSKIFSSIAKLAEIIIDDDTISDNLKNTFKPQPVPQKRATSSGTKQSSATKKSSPTFKYSVSYKPRTTYSDTNDTDTNKPKFKYSYNYINNNNADEPHFEKATNDTSIEEVQKNLSSIDDYYNKKSLYSYSSEQVVQNKNFVAQAKYIEDLTGSPCQEEMLTKPKNIVYANLTGGQLQYYLYWRKEARGGNFLPAHLFYINLYMAELINGFSIFDDTATFKHILKCTNEMLPYYRSVDDLFEQVLSISLFHNAIITFYFFHNINMTAAEINALLPKEIDLDFNTYERPSKKNLVPSPNLLNHVSQYKFIKSDFYYSQYGDLLPQAIKFVFNILDKYLEQNGYNFLEILYPSLFFSTKDFFSFSDDLMYYNEEKEFRKKEITLANGMKIKYENTGLWKYQIKINKTYSAIVGYIIKVIEFELRKQIGFTGKFMIRSEAVINSISMKNYHTTYYKDKALAKLITDDQTTDFIRKSTADFYATTGLAPLIMKKSKQKRKKAQIEQSEDLQKPVVVSIDTSKLQAIRDDSSKLQKLLVVEENVPTVKTESFNCELNDYHDGKGATVENVELSVTTTDTDKQSPQPQQSIVQEEHSSSVFGQLVGNLTSDEFDAVKMLLSNCNIQQKLNEVANNAGLMPEMIIDNINEKSLELINDNIIDATSEPYIYEDYVEQLKKEIL